MTYRHSDTFSLTKDHYELLGKEYTPMEFPRVYEDLVAYFPLRSIEDPFAEDAANDFAELTASLRNILS